MWTLNRNPLGKINLCSLCMMIVLLMAWLKWLIEGVFEQPLFELFIVAAVVFVLLCANKLTLKRVGLVWLFYIVNIIASMLIFSAGMRTWGRSLVTILIVSVTLLIDEEIKSYESVFKFLIILGIMCGLFVLTHY